MLGLNLNIPPISLVSVPVVISGHLPNEFNGTEPTKFDPTRFVSMTKDGKESLRDDSDLLKEGYMPWTNGPRACPGKKFSQVEFVAVMAKVLHAAEVRVASKSHGGESQAAPAKLAAAMHDTVFNLGTKIRDAEQYQIEFVERR
jgi:cytochrome P450